MSSTTIQQLPAVFGRYVLLHRISRGGMGEIFLAKLGEIQGFEKPIVIKKILPQLAQDQEFLQRFVEEAQIAIKLSHGNIVPVYEVGMVGGEYFLALQYIEGRDLRAVIKRCADRGRRLPPDLCLYLIREIANGLSYAHRRTDEAGHPLNLVHCDISPPNVLVTFDGEVKIIDFGIAKSAVQRAAANDEVGFGKFGYMAPEQLVRGGVVDRRTDLYATGIILYELLTGQRVFSFPAGVDHRQVAREVTAGRVAPPSERDLKLDGTFDALVMRALRTEKNERYQSAEDLRDAVQQHLYAMNPTISADALAAFMREVFAEEIGTDRQMLRSLSQTDVEPFRAELNDASSHTVSYALAGGLLRTGAPGLEPLPAGAAGPVLAAAPSLAQPPGVAAPRRASPTRRLSEDEQRAAMGRTSGAGSALPVSQTQPVPSSRGWLFPLLGVAVVLVGAGVAAGLLLTRERATLAGQVASRQAGRTDQGAPAPDQPALAPEASTPPADLPRTAADAAAAISSPPERVRKSDPGQRKTKQARKKPRPKKKVEAISPALVQAKFRQMRAEYLAFTRSYGHLLDAEWQQILFANTYGNKDQSTYDRLNEMLESLRRRMKQVRGGGGS